LRDIDLTLAPPPAALRTRGDAVLIEAALRNIIDNAVKYSSADGAVSVTVTAEDAMACIAVRDRGRGLNGASLSQLKERFRRGPNVGDVVGSGLGLTIVDEAAQAMGGRFTLQEAEGGG